MLREQSSCDLSKRTRWRQSVLWSFVTDVKASRSNRGALVYCVEDSRVAPNFAVRSSKLSSFLIEHSSSLIDNSIFAWDIVADSSGALLVTG